jgi:hypothetical protein
MPDSDVPPRVQELARQLAEPRPMRRGSVSIRYVKCNKAGCPCAEHAEARHGPYVSVVRVVTGKTRSRWVAPELVATVRRQVEAGQAFRKDVEAYWQACEQWADAQLQAPEAAAGAEAAKKGASKKKKPSMRKLSPRSKRS